MSLWSRIANVFRGDRVSLEIREEFESHLGESGRDFGPAWRAMEESRDTKVIAWLDSLRADTIFGWRQIKKRKVTSAAAILSLGLAIGACTSAFRLIDALLFRPLPIASPDRLYSLSRRGFDTHGNPETYPGWQYPAFRLMRAAAKDRAALIAVSFSERAELTYRSDKDMEKARVQYVSGSLFGCFGLRPTLGRLLTESDDVTPYAHPVAVLSHDYWSRRFGKDPNVIGRTFRLAQSLMTGAPSPLYRVVGVAGPGFTGTEPGAAIEVFMPTMMHWGITEPDWSLFRTFAHLRPGVPIEPVRDRLRVALRAFGEESAKKHPDWLKQTLLMEPAAAGVSGTQQNYRLSLAALSVLVALVLLIACANVANLMTAQTAARAREMALRVSIGAGRARLVQLLMVEGAMIAIAATAAGALFAWRAAPFIVGRINAPDNPARLLLPADWRVLAFSLAMTLAVILLFGLAPALGASRVKPAVALKGGEDPRSRRGRMHALIALQAAFCFLVLFVAGLFVSTFESLSSLPTGFSPERLLTLDTVTPHHNEPMPLWDHVAEHLRSVPGVESVAFADWALLDGYGFKMNRISVNGAPPGEADASFINVSTGWLDTMKIPLIKGRYFRADDTSPGVAIVNQTFVKQFFGGGNPIGQWFEGTSAWMRGQRFEIVGIVRDARYRYLREPILPAAFTPFHRMSNMGTMQGGTFVVRTAGPNPLALASTLRQEVASAQPGFRVSAIRTETELIDDQTVRERLLAMLALFFAGVALLLAGIGLYGVLAYSVQQRRREIGIRIAIGAQPRRIVRLVTTNTFSMVLMGAVVGLMAGMASARYIESLLYEVRPTEFGALAIPSVTILAVALLAAAPAVIRAVRIDPAKMLRSE